MVELREALTAAGLDAGGKKAELVSRLEAHRLQGADAAAAPAPPHAAKPAVKPATTQRPIKSARAAAAEKAASRWVWSR